jgi:very-short-patch-repair endonuclease
MSRINNIPKLKVRRRELRKRQTPEEKVLWWHLKDRQIGYKFKRQQSLGGYIVDFYCPDKKLAIELDGSVHDSKESKQYDRLRDGSLSLVGCTVVRISNFDVDKDIFKVITKIKNILAER